jgi:outer membrane protein OmpA-like peptidoglycan-associated protein
MITKVDDDYLICGEYHEQIEKKSLEYPGFITFRHDNGNHYFAWVDGDKIIMRSEAYPDADKMERGIKAVIKNRDISERYSTVESHGAHFLILWGGGEHQRHTGNMESHNEIGRSCPQKSASELKALLAGYNSDLANQINFSGLAPLAASAVTVPYQAANSNTAGNTGGGMGWLKWLLPLLLLAGLAWWMVGKKGCGKTEETAPIVDTVAVNTNVDMPKITVDTVTDYVTYDLGATGDLDLPNGTKIIGAAANGFERTLLNFITTGAIDTVDKTKNWFTIHDVQFKTGTDDYASEKAMVQLTNVVSVLKAFPDVVLKLGGYTDVRGDNVFNKKLSQKRADRVMKDLIKLGAKPSQIKEAVGYGEDFATAQEGDIEGMARDRKTTAKLSSK